MVFKANLACEMLSLSGFPDAVLGYFTATATAPKLRFHIGATCLEVPHVDIQNHPGTLLHDMVAELGLGATVAPVQLDPAASPLGLAGADSFNKAL